MIAQERLYLTSDRRRVVEHGNLDAAFLLAAQGAEIKKEFVPLVEAFYAKKKSVKPSPEVEVSAPTPSPVTADVVENYETHVPKAIRKRGRQPKTGTPGEARGFSGD